jgi:hypothetical protein
MTHTIIETETQKNKVIIRVSEVSVINQERKIILKKTILIYTDNNYDTKVYSENKKLLKRAED